MCKIFDFASAIIHKMYLIILLIYYMLKRKYGTLVKVMKNSIRNTLKEHDKNSKKIENCIKEIINIKQKSSSLPSTLIDKNKKLLIIIFLELLKTI